MALRNGELPRSTGGHAPGYNVSSATTRREFGSQGGSRPGQTAESGEVGNDSGWHVVDARNGRSGRSWAKLFKHLTKLLDDIYFTCELDCSLAHIATMVEYLEVSAGDFAELHSQLESVVSPNGQKIAWEVRACRRASNRSARMVPAVLGFGGGGSGGSGSSNVRGRQGAFGAAAEEAPADSTAAGRGPASGSEHLATDAAAALSGSGVGLPGASSPLTRASSLLGIRRGASCGGAPGGAAAVVAELPPPSDMGASKGVDGGSGGSAARGAGPNPGLVPDLDGPRPPSAGSAAADANPWKGKVNWNELFGRQQHSQRQQQQQRHQMELKPGAHQAAQKLVGGCATSSGTAAAAARAAAVGAVAAVHQAGVFRLGTALPPPRLKVRGATGGGGGGSGGGGSTSGSGGGSTTPTAGTASPMDSLYHKLLSSPSRKLSPSEVRRASEERHARAEKARQAMVEERLARLAQANQSRQTVRSIMEERAGAIAARVDSKIARSAELRQAHLAERVQKAVEETKKVAEVAFINQMLEQDKKLALQEKLEEGEIRRRQALEALQQRGKGAAAAVEEAQERRKMLEAERREQLADRQRRKLAAQAKLEEERRAAAAAREAASRAQRAAAAQVAEARQRLRDVLSVRIEERLREAAARRAQHLELIKERAALGKDLYDRRVVDGNTTSPRSPQSRYTRPPSPEVPSAGAGGSQASVPPPPPLGRPVTPPGGGAGGGGGGLRPWQSGVSTAASAAAAAIGAATPQPPPSSPSWASYVGGSAFAADGSGSSSSPLRSSDRAITLSADPRRRLKGMRRRACKTLARLEAARPSYEEPPHVAALLEGADGRELVAAWAQLVEAARRDTAAAAAAEVAAAALAGKAGRGKRGVAAGAAASAATGSAPHATATAAPVAWIASDGGAAARGSCGGAGGGGSCSNRMAGSGGRAGSISTASEVAAAAATAAVTAAGAAVKHLLQRVHTDLGGRSKGIALHAARPSGLLTALAELLTAPAAATASHPPQTSVQLMELLALLATSSPCNAAWLLARCGGGALGGLVRCAMRALDRYNGLAADEVWEEPPEARYLAALLQTLACLCRTPFPDQPSLRGQQEELVAYVVACGLIHKSTELFSLFDQPAANDKAPIPGYVLQCLALLEAVTGGPRRRSPAAALTSQKRWLPPAANGAAIALAFQETAMAGLPSLLTAVLLRAAPSCTPAEARPEQLPPNFVEAAACVMRVLNNIARLDLIAAQSSLGASDLRVVFFHLVGFLLSYCTNQWPTGRGVEPAIYAALSAAAAAGGGGATTISPGCGGGAPPAAVSASRSASAGGARPSPSTGGTAAAPPPTAPPPLHTGLVQLLNEVLLLIGFYGVLQPANQDVLLWGKSPTILQRLAEVPFPYFVEQQLYQVLMPTLLSVCYGSERACATLAQHMDLHLLRSYVQTIIRQCAASPSAPAVGAGTRHADGTAPSQGAAETTHGSAATGGAAAAATSAQETHSPPSNGNADKEESKVAAAGPTPLSPRRHLLEDLLTTVSGMPAVGVGAVRWPGDSPATSAHSSCSASRGRCVSGGGAGGALAAFSDALALPVPTADRYSLPQRFPPELLPRVLAFLERQDLEAVERAGSAEPSLAAAVAAAAAAGRLTAAAPQMSSSPLAVLGVDGLSSKKTPAKKPAPTLPPVSAASGPATAASVGGGGAERTPPVDSVAIVTASGAAGAGAVVPSVEDDHEEAAALALAPGTVPGEKTVTVTEATHGSLTPVRMAGQALQHAAATGLGAAAESPTPSSGAGAGGTGSSGRAASSSGSFNYSHNHHHHFRRYLDAADVPVPFAAGATRRHKLLEVAAAAAVAAVAEGASGGGGSTDTNNCARSYVSELSFAGAYLTSSLQGDSREGDPRSPGEDERMMLDEFDLEQYEQQRFDEQQHLDEQDVLLLDEPLLAEGNSGGGRRLSRAFVSAVAAAPPRQNHTARRSERETGEELGGGSPPDHSAGLLARRKKKSKGRADHGEDSEASSSAAARQIGEFEVLEPTGVVMNAWWRRVDYQFGGVDAGSDSESASGKRGRELRAAVPTSLPTRS